MPETSVIPVEGPGDLAAAFAIREVVFIEEEQVPLEMERDDRDEAAFHVLAMQAGHAIGTGRLLVGEEPPHDRTGKWGRIGRMAVLEKYRAQGVGQAILMALEAEARERGLVGIVVHSQVHARGFYERRGYIAHGPEFEEAGIAHIGMSKEFEIAP